MWLDGVLKLLNGAATKQILCEARSASGGTDYDGSSVSAEDARKFLENRIKGGLMAGPWARS